MTYPTVVVSVEQSHQLTRTQFHFVRQGRREIHLYTVDIAGSSAVGSLRS